VKLLAKQRKVEQFDQRRLHLTTDLLAPVSSEGRRVRAWLMRVTASPIRCRRSIGPLLGGPPGSLRRSILAHAPPTSRSLRPCGGLDPAQADGASCELSVYDAARAASGTVGISIGISPQTPSGNAARSHDTSLPGSAPLDPERREPEVRRERRVGKASLEAAQALAFIKRVRGDVDEADDLLRHSGDARRGATIRMTDEHDRAVNLVDHRHRVRGVVRRAAQRVRRSDHVEVVVSEFVVEGGKARRSAKAP
jgi:hypothetical protein